jgi:hypothetical protein
VIKKFKSGQENETETVTNVKTNVCVFVGCGVRRQLKEKKLIKKKRINIFYNICETDMCSAIRRSPLPCTRGRKHTSCFSPSTLTLQSSHSRSCQRTTLALQRRGHPLRSTDRNPLVSHRLYPTYSVRCIAIPPITIILTFLYRPHCREASEQEITSKRCSTRAL